MITILHLADNRDVPVPARITHDPQTGTTRLIIAWPDGAERVMVTGFTLTATTTDHPLTLESGDTLTIPLPYMIGTER
jgi:hypothetical protein